MILLPAYFHPFNLQDLLSKVKYNHVRYYIYSQNITNLRRLKGVGPGLNGLSLFLVAGKWVIGFTQQTRTKF